MIEGFEAGLARERRKAEERGRSEVKAILGSMSFEGVIGWLLKVASLIVSGEESW